MDKQTELKICELYKNGVKTKDIYSECHCSSNTVSKILDKYGIPKRQIHNTKKDLTKLYNLSLPETQYWIGFICADGSINYNENSRIYKVSLFSKDLEVIDKFIKYIGKENVSTHTRKQNGVHEVYISSKKLCEYFINNLNITPNKSLTLNPNIEFTNNFILGYFDGDGCIRNSSEKQTRYECNITCGNIKFLEKIKEKLDEQDIYSCFYKHNDSNAYKLRIDRKEDSKKFYKWLYKDAIVCLSRKLKNFVALFGNIENEKLGELQELVGESAAKLEE